MKEFCQELLQAINGFYPIQKPRGNGRYVVGALNFKGNLFSFIIEENRGIFRLMENHSTYEWFDLAGTPRKYTAIIYEGVRYEKDPTLYDMLETIESKP